MREYDLYTLDAAGILAKGKETTEGWKFEIDFNMVSVKNDVLMSENRHNENALFYQIREVLSDCSEESERKTKISDYDKGLLQNQLVYVDFKKIFRKNKEKNEKTKEIEEKKWNDLLKKGFFLTVEGEREPVRFMPFDKSASMSRRSIMTFINEEIREEVDRRVRLDIDFSKIEVQLSKYYAYRGLMMTDAARIEKEKLILNENTVIILSDVKHEAGQISDDETFYRTLPLKKPKAGEDYSGGYPIEPETETDNERKDKFELTGFDGEGIIAPDYAEMINQCLRLKDAASFQIRMPYTKGMLHQVDFASFLQEEFVKGHLLEGMDPSDEEVQKQYEMLEVEDCFGISRKICEARIIMCESMFKGGKWLKALSEQMCEETGLTDKWDPMKFYFERFHTYHHALYVGNTDKNLSDTGTVQLNYQFLNTIGFTKDDFQNLVANHVKKANALVNDPDYARKKLLANQALEESEDPSEAAISRMQGWKYALLKNKRFMKDPFIRKRLDAMRDSMLYDIGSGNLEVKGALLFLTDDLLHFLARIVEKMATEGMSEEEQKAFAGKKESFKEDVGKEHLFENKFFAPRFCGNTDVFKEFNGYCSILRSPHLSRNEQSVLRSYEAKDPKDLYYKYFGHLKGVLMLAYNSNAAKILGGADFDGDTVKLILDKIVNKSVLNTSFEKIQSDNNGKKSTWYKRKYPIVDIPSVGAESKEPAPAIISGKVLSRTFSSRVGQISNSAIKEAKLFYTDPNKKKQNGQLPVDPALYTAATGLEIDAAKTGIRPKLENMMNTTEDYFLERKKAVTDPFAYLNKTAEETDETNIKPTGYFRIEAKKEEKGKNIGKYKAVLRIYSQGTERILIYAMKEPTDEEICPMIDYLPYYCLKALADRKTKRQDIVLSEDEKGPETAKTTPVPDYFFTFEQENNWKKELKKADAEGLLDRADQIVKIYQKVNGDIKEIREAYRDAKMVEKSGIGQYFNLLKIEYDYDVDYFETMDIETAANMAYLQMLDYYAQRPLEEVAELLKRLKDEPYLWIYNDNFTEKREFLKEIFGEDRFPEETLKILCDEYKNGFMLLYLLLLVARAVQTGRLSETNMKDKAEERKAKKTDQSTETEANGKERLETEEVSEEDELYQKLFSCYGKYREAGKVSADMKEICRKELETLFENHMDTAFQYVYAGKNDRAHKFLWEIFTAEDIKELVYSADRETEEDNYAG